MKTLAIGIILLIVSTADCIFIALHFATGSTPNLIGLALLIVICVTCAFTLGMATGIALLRRTRTGEAE